MTAATPTRFPVIDEDSAMAIFRRVVLAAALAGLVAGVALSALHLIGAAPLIAKAEVYEHAAEVSAALPAHGHEEIAWTPADGFERAAFTVLADLLTAIGFGLLLISAYALRGTEMDWRKGLLWGLAGFVTFTLAPALGLPPELPGTEAAPLHDRQLWWIGTALATGSGLALMFFGRRWIWTLTGVALLALPHIVGAPGPAKSASVAPASLELQFIAVAVGTSALFWLALGALTGLFYQRLQRAS